MERIQRDEGAWNFLYKNNNTNHPALPETKPLYMDRPITPAAYVAEDELVGHQWKEKSLVLPMLDPPV